MGESARSLYERAGEHHKDSLSEKRQKASHMAEHAKDAPVGNINFKFKVLNSYRSSMERQIAETVKVKLASKREVDILNNKAEYNRCLLPELEVRLGKDKASEVGDKKDEKRVFSQGRKLETEKGRARK